MKNFLFIYKYNNVNGGFNDLINKFSEKIIKDGNNIFILTTDSAFKKKDFVVKNNFFVYHASPKNLLILLFRFKIYSICIFEPVFKHLYLDFLFKLFHPSIINNLYFCGSKTEHQSIIERGFLVLMKPFFNNFIACSQYAAKTVFINNKIKNMQIIFCPIYLHRYKTTKGLFNKKLIALDRVAKRKNYLDLIRAFKEVNDADKTITLDVIGDYKKIYNRTQNKNYANQVFSMISDYKLNKFITFHGDVSESRKVELLEQGSIFIKTSSHEMQGISTTEALAAGLPVIAFNNTGTREVVIASGGILIPDKDIHAMAEAILSLISNKNLLKKLSVMSSNAASEYSHDKTVNRFLSVISSKNHSSK